MQLQPIVYVTDMERSTAWYARLLDAQPVTRSEYWTTFSLGGGTLALHAEDDVLSGGSVELSLVSGTPLENVLDRVDATTEIIRQPFGRSFVATDPDGTTIQVNEHA